MRNKILTIAGLVCILSLSLPRGARCYWLWTPDSKTFINPKYAVKDTPNEQYDWAMSFFTAKDYPRAVAEFEKLVKHYGNSECASEAQYYAGLSYEEQGKYYFAFESYQKVVEEYPHSARLEEVIEREFHIGNIYLAKTHSKLLGSDIMAPIDRAIEIFRKVVENVPYGPYADKAQYRLGLAYKKAEYYEEAIIAFQKLVDEYPQSPLAEKARYELASCAYRASLKPAYDSESTEKAVAAFKDFVEANRDGELEREADETLTRLVDNLAEKLFSIARFYEHQKHYRSALVYYREVLQKYPKSSFATAAAEKVKELLERIEVKR